MNNVDINFDKLIDLVAQKDESEKMQFVKNKRLETEQEAVKINNDELERKNMDPTWQNDIKDMVNDYKDAFNESEKKYLWKMFLSYSSDGVSGI